MTASGSVDDGLWHPPLRVKLAVFSSILFLCLLIFELACRAAGADFNPNPIWRFHPTLGWTQERSMEFGLDMDGEQVTVQFNSLGFRDIEHPVAKPPGTKRVVVVGDSFGEAAQVNLEETYWHRLGQLLSSSGADTWEIINLSVGDYGTAQAFRALQEFGLRFSPDLVLVQLLPLNDICNNSIELAGLCHSTNDSYRPYFVESDKGFELTWVQPVRQWLRTRLISFGVLEKSYLLVKDAIDLRSDDQRHRSRYTSRGFAADPIFYTFVPDADQEAVAAGWRTTEGILEMIDRLCEDLGIPWLPVVMPSEIVLAGPWEKFSKLLTGLDVVRDYPEQRLAALFERLGVPSVLLLDAFDKRQEQVLPYRQGHLNPAGHDLAARVIHDTLLAEELVPGAWPLSVNFGDSTARASMLSGWHQDESVGDERYVWSDGERSVLKLSLPDRADARVVIECQPFRFPNNPQQRVSIVVNGIAIDEIPLRPDRAVYTVTLPKAALGELTDTVEFRYAYARRARDVLPGSSDDRLLGVAWHTVSFGPELAALPLRLDFGEASAREWMGTGWYHDEAAGNDTYVWGGGERSVLQVPLPLRGNIRMSFDCLPFLYPGSATQKVSVVVNGTVIAELALWPRRDTYSVTLPRDVLTGGPNTVELRYAYAREPREVQKNQQDDRRLAVAWYSMDFALLER